ncbi:MAG TPA: hypothetical protein VKB93_01575 [Thermoanaerobaculia bacterium]|nr:hypothetical protein [Thermoanaerobaculia bacterium]
MRKIEFGDSMLEEVQRAGSAADRERALSKLLDEHVYDRIDRIISARMRQTGFPEQERDDIRSEVLLKVMARLKDIRSDTEIASFRDYVAVVAFNTFEDFVRRTHPERTRLKARIRYALRRDQRFSVWPSAMGWACGLNSWTGRNPGTWHDDASGIALPHDDLVASLLLLFDAVGQPLLLDQVVSVLAAAEGISVRKGLPYGSHDATPSATRSVIEDLEAREYLRQLWKEIRTLPVRQRVALLLHARDSRGESVARLLPLTRVGSFHDLAEALEVTVEELAAIWDQLPLDDLTIATRLGLQRQQVINLRRAARDRLSRRMQGDDDR